jgi:predicted transcriptional regulator
VVYLPRQSKLRAGARALQHVLDTFFGGALDEALAAHLARKEALTNEQLARIQQLIKQARKQGC